MREVLPELMAWWRAGETVGVGTVVATFQSAPRPPGASMLVGPDGEAVGSVSGGCVEGAVYELARTVVAVGDPVLERYGVSDDDDCDHHPGEDGDDHGGGGADLPYDVVPALGATVRPIFDAFAEEGMQPASIVSVTLDGGTWRAAELSAGTPFVVTSADCDHAGNRDTGRDRVVVTWTNADGSSASDHLDIRYCSK